MYFNLFGIICGGVLSYYLIAIRSRRLLLVTIYHLPYRFWRSYDELYDAAETRFTYEMVGDGSSKNHADFLSSLPQATTPRHKPF